MRIAAYIFGGLAVLVALLFGWSVWFTRVPPIDTSNPDLAKSLETWFEERHSHAVSQFNGAALVIHDGQTVLRGAWGKDGEGRELTPDSQFRLASVSKSFTAAAILKLAQDGLIDLDLPVGEQIDQCPMQATPAQLMRHLSGIDDNYFANADPAVITTVSSVFDGVCDTVEGVQAPAEYSYNNTAYVFLAGLVERKSGMSFEAYLAQELLEPLGLSSTRVWNLVSEDEFTDRAITFDASGALSPTNLDGVAGDGAVFSTVDDLANWARFWRDDRLINKELKDRATGRAIGDDYHFGLGREGDTVSHTGGWLGARTYLGFKDVGDDGDVVILLDNGSSEYGEELVSQIWQALE
ncbi:MAG: serine hydrolase domain-containing protein [Pseudomonadota bacterium]